jgi:hypothetical protein
MVIIGYYELLTLSGLDSLSSIGSDLIIMRNSSLKNLHGMENLVSAGSILIIDNYSLLNLNGLQSLLHIDYDINIDDNPSLFSISGISNIDMTMINQLIIDLNYTLSDCDVKSVCNYLADPGGFVGIHDNAPGCNSQEEVELACSVGVEEVVSRQSSVVSYPNPVRDRVTFSIRLEDPAKVKLTVFNSMGQIVATILDEALDKGDHLVTWNGESLSPGIYFYRLSTANCQLSTSGKMIIVR